MRVLTIENIRDLFTNNIRDFLKSMKEKINENSPTSWGEFYDEVENSTLSSLEISVMNTALMSTGINPLLILNYIPVGFFFSRQDLTEYKIPNNITSIENSAFDSCGHLQYLYIPKSVQFIEQNVFYNCPDTMVIEYEGNEEEWKDIFISSNSRVENKKIIYMGR